MPACVRVCVCVCTPYNARGKYRATILLPPASTVGGKGLNVGGHNEEEHSSNPPTPKPSTCTPTHPSLSHASNPALTRVPLRDM